MNTKHFAFGPLTHTPLAAYTYMKSATVVCGYHFLSETKEFHPQKVGGEVTVTDDQGKPHRYPSLLAAINEFRRPCKNPDMKWGLVFNSRGELTHRFRRSGELMRAAYIGHEDDKDFPEGPLTRQMLGI